MKHGNDRNKIHNTMFWYGKNGLVINTSTEWVHATGDRLKRNNLVLSHRRPLDNLREFSENGKKITIVNC